MLFSAKLVGWSSSSHLSRTMTGPANLEGDPLTVALDCQDEDILHLLLKDGVYSSYAINLQGSSVLHVAMQLNRPRMLQVLLEEGMDLDRQDQLGRTALHFTALAQSLQMARILVEFGANAQLTDNQDQTLHHVAAASWQILLQCLLANDPDTVFRQLVYIRVSACPCPFNFYLLQIKSYSQGLLIAAVQARACRVVVASIRIDGRVSGASQPVSPV